MNKLRPALLLFILFAALSKGFSYTAISANTLYTADLNIANPTVYYTITLPNTLKTLAITMTTTDTVKYASIYFWTPTGGMAQGYGYLGTGYAASMFSTYTACASYNYAFGACDIELRISTTGLTSADNIRFNFYVTVSTQSDGFGGLGDAGNAPVYGSAIFDGTFTGYMDKGDTEDWYAPAISDGILTASVTTDSKLGLTMRLIDGSKEKNVNVPPGATASLTQFYSADNKDRQYFGVMLTSGTGNYSFTLSTNYTYQCVVPYPNPFDTSKNHTKITFAGTGVPYAKIRIYTFDGKLIKTLEETAGSTKLEWKPLDDGLPSGIYYYGAKNAVEKNMGSITIIR